MILLRIVITRYLQPTENRTRVCGMLILPAEQACAG